MISSVSFNLLNLQVKCCHQFIYLSHWRQFYSPMSIPTTFNHSDYEYLLRSLTEGHSVAKAEALKRFQILACSDKKQFSVYAKRIVLALQELVNEPKEEINLLTTTLVLEIINLNPKDIQFYLRTKLLKKIVINLGDMNPQLRKTSHYCILAYIKTYNSIDEIISLYCEHGIGSLETQLRQKAINSFQSIVITEPTSVNWNSDMFKRIFQMLLQKLKDPNSFVQKAAEQCLLTLSRMEDINAFTNKLTSAFAGIYRIFCEAQRELGNLEPIKAENNYYQNGYSLNRNEQNSTQKPINFSPINQQKLKLINRQDSYNKQALIEKIEQIRRNALIDKMPDVFAKLSESKEHSKDKQKILHYLIEKQKAKQGDKIEQKIQQKSPPKIEKKQSHLMHSIIFANKSERLENVFGKKLLQDLKNDKDWKIRLEAVEELHAKFQVYKQAFQIQLLMKNLIPSLIKLLSDQNFKIATITLKIIEELLKLPQIPLQVLVPQIVERLGDGKVALRQGVARLIRNEYLQFYNPIWLDTLLEFLRKSSSSTVKQDILSFLTHLYEDELPKYPIQKIVQAVCPLMDDPKTKIKIRTLQLLVFITIATQRIDAMKLIISPKLSQVYYEMYLEKVGKQMKHRVTPRLVQSEPLPKGETRSLSIPSLRKHKNSTNNTTSASSQKYSQTLEANPITRRFSLQKIKGKNSKISQQLSQFQQNMSSREISYLTSESGSGSGRKNSLKIYKKKIQSSIESKLTITHSVQIDSLKPLSDPSKQAKNLLKDLKSEDWQTAYDALTRLRRILRFHQDVLNPSIIRPLAIETANLIENLRSSLCKNAVIALGELAHAVGRNLDPELDHIMSRLMRKTLETNSFISEEVRKTLIIVSSSCSEAKILNSLINYHKSRALPVKLNILSVLQHITFMPTFFEKQLEKIATILVQFMSQGALEIRQRAKMMMGKIIQYDDAGRFAKLIPAELLHKIKKMQISYIDPEPKVEKQTFSLVKNENSQQQNKQKKKTKILNFPKQFSELQQIVNSCESTEWKKRQQSLEKLVTFVKTYPQDISQYRLGSKIIQIFAKLSNDSNSKVAAVALCLFIEIAPLVPRLIGANLTFITNELFNSFASQKVDIRDLALALFDKISDHLDHWLLVQHLCHGALYGPAKAKGNILVKLIKVLPKAFKQRKTVVEKHIYGMLNKLAQDPNREFVPILKQLINQTLTIGGDEASSTLKQATKDIATG